MASWVVPPRRVPAGAWSFLTGGLGHVPVLRVATGTRGSGPAERRLDRRPVHGPLRPPLAQDAFEGPRRVLRVGQPAAEVLRAVPHVVQRRRLAVMLQQ